MQQNKSMPAAAWLACLTIAAYLLAQAAVMIMSGSFDAALLKSASLVAQNRSENVVPLPRPNAWVRNKSANGQEGAACTVKVEQVSDTRWILDRASLPENNRELSRFLMQARAVPCMKKGRIVGFRITAVSRGSIYEKIGFRKGDVLLRVNMRKLDDPAKLFSLYREMRNKQHVSILLSRNGRSQTFDYDIR